LFSEWLPLTLPQTIKNPKNREGEGLCEVGCWDVSGLALAGSPGNRVPCTEEARVGRSVVLRCQGMG
jgi:hypothetical protein